MLHVLNVVAVAENQGNVHLILQRRWRRYRRHIDCMRHATIERCVTKKVTREDGNSVLVNPVESVSLTRPPTDIDTMIGRHVRKKLPENGLVGEVECAGIKPDSRCFHSHEI